MSEWTTIRLGSVVRTNTTSYSPKEGWKYVNYLDTGNITENVIDAIQHIDLENEKLPSRAKRKVQINSILYSTVRPNQKHFGIIKSMPKNFLVSTGFAVIDVIPEKADADYLYFWLTQNTVVEQLHAIAEQSVSAYPSIKASDIENLEIALPPLTVQKSIASILKSISDKMSHNSSINENLEQQLRSVFMELFSDKIANVEANNHRPLGELVINIDNRGKTPPLETTPTEYPIIDVRALSGTSRIVNYANCTKFVSAETYSSWFRSGHPKPKDILVSTVGSLAEIKIFLGSKGCIAQNVVGFRTKDISPYYLYQYLTAIKNDLVAYNIGSVQPSIKVTHIIKHPIYIPSTEELETFDALAESATNAIYNNTLESERLAGIRDALIPKLMSGEIDLSEVQF